VPLVAVAVATAPTPVVAQPAPGADKAELAAADKAVRAKDWDAALTHYQAAQQASPSPQAQLGAANSLYQLGRLGEAYEAYDQAQRDYAAKLGAADKATVAARLKDLAAKTGWLSVRVNEVGAQVDVDGKTLGTSPVPVLVRVPVGPHDIRISKAGFSPFASRAEVAPDGKAVIEANLVREATQAHLVVQASEPLRVSVDGVDVGSTPWEGDVAAGAHEIGGHSSTATALPQQVTVKPGDRSAVSLVVAATAAHLQVRTSDGKGLIYVDGAVKAEGAFSADVGPGPHTVVVSREGYERFEKALTLAPRETWAETVTLKPTGGGGGEVKSAERAFDGIYGGFGLAGLFGVGGQGTEIETRCDTLGASSCDAPSPIGGGAFGYVGWTWNPVGFELMLGASGDTVQQTAHFSGVNRAGTVLPISAPARDEKFTFARFGGVAAVRVRASFQNGLLRGTVAGGLGVSYKQMLMKRESTATDGTGRKDTYVPDGVSYTSPAISLEGALQLRVSGALAIALGLEMWADNASIFGSNAAPLR